MKFSGYFDPYFPPVTGKPDRAQMKDSWDSKKAGVYFIRHKATKSIVYVGMSGSQLKKTIYRHFQQWRDAARKALWGDPKRKTYPKQGYDVRFIYCTPVQAAKIEKLAIQKHKPKDNVQQYENYFGKTEPEQARALEKLEDYDRGPDGRKIPFMKKGEYLDDTPDWAK